MLSLDKRDYEIYSAVLDAFFGDFPPMSILDRTGYSWLREEVIPEGVALKTRFVMVKNPELLASFHERNAEAGFVEHRFSTAVKCTVTPFLEGASGWQFSRVGYSYDGRFALAAVSLVGRPQARFGMLVVCKKNGDKWTCEKVREWCS